MDKRLPSFEFQGKSYAFRPLTLAALALVVGVIGGIYGIGGAAIIAPFLITILRLPAHAVAEAALFGTLITSIVGVLFFEFLGQGRTFGVRPDWALGLLFGVGGLAGSYVGALVQKRLPERWIRMGLAVLVMGLGLHYATQFLRTVGGLR